ncbi:spore germination protein [Clostridium aceticum]|uniref:Spore germination protein n=1 Tax=Clostridium aceticum TaxID=84022 RepID=A0A0D8I614_9CLOT|nr:endospore germination permease [Clostridium aceticum]AKL95847.1 spore germination protein [Clostridium aceticum]KJF25462.1 hypothetical protein TZ02_18630 [Clostridium aceticum]
MKDQLEDVNMLSFVVHTMVGVRLLTLPKDIVEHAQNDGWASIALATLVSFVIGFAFYWMGKKYSRLNISQIAEVVLGRFLGKIIMIAIAVYLIFSIGLSLRAFADSVKLFLLDMTPLYIIILVMLGTCVYCVKQGIKTISIVFDLLLPIIVIAITVLMLFSATNIDHKNLLPVFHGGAKPIFQGFLETTHPFLGIGIIGYIMPCFKEQKKVKKWIAIGILLVSAIYFSIVIMSIMVFGSREIQHILHPTIALSRALQLDIEMFERLEVMFMAVWIPMTFTTLAAYYFASVINLKVMFRSEKEQLMLYGQIPIIFLIALLPNNVVEVHALLSINNKLAQVHSFIIIPVIFIGVLVKQRGGKSV